MADEVKSALELYTEAQGALRDQRQQIAEDLAFSDPSNPQQWDLDEKRRREQDPGGARPCLVFDNLGQYVSNVTGQIEKQPPSLHALPVGGGAKKKVAEHLDGHFRHIEHASRAGAHYGRAGTSAARAGVGYLVIRPEYTERALGYQEPRISSEGDPLRVVFDPWSVALDGSDANFGFLLSPYSQREFKRRWPGKDLVSFGSEDQQRVKDERESVLVVDAWTTEDKASNVVTFLDIRGDEVALPEDQYWQAYQRGEVHRVQGTHTEKRRIVWWRRLSGADVLERCLDEDGKEMPFPSDFIGLVPMYGYVGFSDGRMTYCGIPRRARAAQQSYNFHMSEARAYVSTAPKAPWIASKRAIQGLEKLWDRASVEMRAYLPFNDLDEEGTPIAPPQRTSVAADIRNHMQGAEQALRDIQAAIGMYQANLGAPSNETSGVAIDARKEQGESSTAHFQSHMAASVAHVGTICLQMVQRLCDTKRQFRMLSIDGQPSAVVVNPEQAEPMQEGPGGISINPNVGRYDVRIVVGAAYTTQRQQARDAYVEMMRANPNLAPAIAPMLAQVLDVPNADKLSQVFTALAPPQVQDILKPEGNEGPTTDELKAKVEQLSQALQEAVQLAHEAQAEAEEANAALQQKHADSEAKEAETQIRAYDAVTKRLSVTGANEQQVQAIVMKLLQDMAAATLPMEGQEGSPEGYEMQAFPAEFPTAEMAPEMSNDDAGNGQ